MPQIFLAGAVLLIIFSLVIHWRMRFPYLFTGWLWFIGTLVPVIGIDPRWALFALPSGRAELASAPGLLVETARHGPPAAGMWQSVTALGKLERGRHGLVAESYLLYRVNGIQGLTPSALLPRP